MGLDGEYYRAGVCAVIVSAGGQLMVFERSDVPGAWQFPQGGIKRGEDPELALYREVEEETGLRSPELRILHRHPHPLAYELPTALRRRKTGRGQVLSAYYLALADATVQPRLPVPGEFSRWRWCDPAEAVAGAAAFRRQVYAQLAAELAVVEGSRGGSQPAARP